MEEQVSLLLILVIAVALSLADLLADVPTWRQISENPGASLPFDGWGRTRAGQVFYESLHKTAALIIWIPTSSAIRDDGSSALLTPISWVILAGGWWLVLIGQRRLLRWHRRRRISRMLQTGSELGFPGTLHPFKSTGDDLWIRVAPDRLTVAADRSLPEAFRHTVSATVVQGSRRRANDADAPGRLRWESITLLSNGGEHTLSAPREYLDAVIACLPPTLRSHIETEPYRTS